MYNFIHVFLLCFLNSDLADNGKHLGTSTSQSASQSSFESVSLSDKLSNYKFINIIVAATSETAFYNSYVVPVSVLEKITNYGNMTGMGYDARCQYVNDTTLKIRQMRNGSTATSSCKVLIYGIK